MDQDYEQYRVLVVDDDEVDRMAVRRALRSAGLGVEVREAEDVEAALSILREGGLDCVFLDYELPGGNGIRVLEEAASAGIRTPIVVLTGHEDTELAVELMKAGAADYLAKGSLSAERLSRSLRGAVRLHAAEETAREAETALRESEARYRLLFEQNPLPMWVYEGETLRFLAVNEAAVQHYGYSREEFLQMTIRDIRPPEDVSAVETLQRHRPVGSQGVWRHRKKGGEVIQVEITVNEIVFMGRPARFVSANDVTRRLRAEAEREKALAARGQFYAAMSHEIRTPINAIMGYNDLLLSGVFGSLDAAQQEGLGRAQKAVYHLLELVNDVLDLSKLEAGKIELQTERVDVRALVQDLFNTIRPLAEEKESALSLQCDGPLPMIVTDPRRVRQILLNLLSNAIKFGAGEPVSVRCSTRAGGVVVEVTDRGPGIAPEDVDRIFEEFVQLPNAETGGTGLGLAISLRLADLLGGQLEVESALGGGCCFRLVLPPEVPEDAPPTDSRS